MVAGKGKEGRGGLWLESSFGEIFAEMHTEPKKGKRERRDG